MSDARNTACLRAFFESGGVDEAAHDAVKGNYAMRKMLITLCAGVAAVATAGSALAQVYGDTMQREASIRDRISDGLNSGDLTFSQAARLRSELHQIQNLDARYQDEGMTGWQMRDLNSRLSLLDSRLNYDVSLNRGEEDYGY